MSGYLVLLIWPAGLAAIFGAAFAVSRARTGRPAVGGRGQQERQERQGQQGRQGRQEREGREAGRHQSHRASGSSALADASDGSWRFAIVAAVGAAAAFAVMALLGLLVVHHGLTIDRPTFRWVHGHQVHAAAAAMKRLTKIGDTWTTWGAAAAAAVCLAVASRDRRWLPPVALAALIVVDHYATLALRHVFHRLGPPTSPLGTYPSGGCDRSIVIYGLIAYLLWREFSGRPTTAVWAAAAVAALGFNEAYSRVYLSLHWFTDALSGLLYGGLLLAAFIIAVRAATGRPVAPRAGLTAAEGYAA